MSANTVIRIENVSKKFMIRHEGAGGGLRHVVQEAVLRPAKMLRAGVGRFRQRRSLNGNSDQRSRYTRREEFWALRDISLEIKQGEVVGVIGRNGAGKSTLLKILSRITDPTTGRIGIKGRVASLLEVGTGFHPELTGRENVFLNGAILGMARLEIVRHFDEIVEFAGIGKFIDTPVKRYSSGMYLRLAFAVAAHLNPEILVIDEILAVGDSGFQKRCLGKIQEVASGMGRTVLFVSHQLESVLALCTRVCLLNAGRLEADGEPDAIVQLYQSSSYAATTRKTFENPNQRPGRGTVRITSVRPERQVFDPDAKKVFFVSIVTNDVTEGPFYLALSVIDQQQRQIVILDTHHSDQVLAPGDPFEVRIDFNGPWLCPGEYRIDAFLYHLDIIDRWEDACRFTVSNRMPYSSAICEPVIRGSIVLPDFSVSQYVSSGSAKGSFTSDGSGQRISTAHGR
jgi:lipopolysaccharide transport system ATP-binding protein